MTVAAATDGPRVARFASKFVRQSKGRWAGLPLALEPWQVALCDDLFEVDEQGRLVYREALVGVARKNGKSSLGSLFALYMLTAAGENSPEVYAAAASKEQARIVFDQAREFVNGSPRLADTLKPMRNVITCPANDGIFRVLASDAPLQHGLNPSGVVIDELWAHKDPELYYALTTGSLARENPLVVSITTAGFDRDSLLFKLYQRGRELEREGPEAMRRERFLFRWWSAQTDCRVDDRAAWAEANPSSWIDHAELERETKRLPDFVFRRLHLNQWTEIEDAWVTPHEWDACSGLVRHGPDQPTFVGVDIGIKRDATAFVWCQWQGEVLHVGHKLMVPKPDVPIHSADARELLAQTAERLGGVHEIAYDPWQFRESAEMLSERGLPMIEVPQNNAVMSEASEQLYELVKDRRLVHDGDELFRGQILNAVAAPTERGWRISKRKSQARIDGAVALAMAAAAAVAWKVTKPINKGISFG